MDNIFALVKCFQKCFMMAVNFLSNHSNLILCVITYVSVKFIYGQLETANINNILEIESKVIHLKNEIDLLEKEEKNTNTTNFHLLMYMMSNGNIDANGLLLNQNHAQIIEKNSQIYKEKIKHNYYLALDTMAFIVLRNTEKIFQNKYDEIISEVYEKIKDNEKSKRTYPNIIKFVEEIQPKTLA